MQVPFITSRSRGPVAAATSWGPLWTTLTPVSVETQVSHILHDAQTARYYHFVVHRDLICSYSSHICLYAHAIRRPVFWYIRNFFSGPSCSCVFYQGAGFLTSLTLQHPPIPANPIYYPPSTYHVHYQLPNELTPTPPVPPTAGEVENDQSSTPAAISHRNTRTTYTAKQLQTLEKVFSEKKYVNFEDRLLISREVGVTEKQVKMWFQNRRTKMRKQLQSHHSSNRRTRSKSTM